MLCSLKKLNIAIYELYYYIYKDYTSNYYLNLLLGLIELIQVFSLSFNPDVRIKFNIYNIL